MDTGQPHSIALRNFRELWIHTGTTCNLSCPFCHEGSKPGDARIEAPSPVQLAPLLTAAAARGVQRFAFTGGEPLIHRSIREILLHALSLRPVLVLTNGTAPFIRRSHQLAELAAAPHAATFRVSIDFADEARHDAGRGYRNFRKALEGLRLLHAAGFAIGITRQRIDGEDVAAVGAAFRQLLRRQKLPDDMPIIALPELGPPGVTQLPGGGTNAPAVPPACATGRMLLQRQGAMHFHACPLTDDELRFDMGTSLADALAAPVVPDHARCARCRESGVDYAGAGIPLA